MADPTMNSKDVEMKETEEQKKEEADEQQQSKKDKDPITFLGNLSCSTHTHTRTGVFCVKFVCM